MTTRKELHETYWQFAMRQGWAPWHLTGKAYELRHYYYQRFCEQFRSVLSIHRWLKKEAPNRLYGARINKAGEAI